VLSSLRDVLSSLRVELESLLMPSGLAINLVCGDDGEFFVMSPI